MGNDLYYVNNDSVNTLYTLHTIHMGIYFFGTRFHFYIYYILAINLLLFNFML